MFLLRTGNFSGTFSTRNRSVRIMKTRLCACTKQKNMEALA